MKQVKKTKRSKATKRKRWLTVLGVLMICIAGFFGYRYYKDHQSYKFDTPEQADFYVLAENGISSFSYQEGTLQETSNNSFKLIEHGLNHYLYRPTTQNRYLLFKDEYGPSWKTGRLISVDFEKGKVITKKSGDSSSQTAGQSSEYFLIPKTSANDNYLAVYTPNLECIDQYKFNQKITAYNFSVDGNQIYFYAIGVADNAFYLYHFDLVDGKLNLVQETNLSTNEDSISYSQSVLIENKLITTTQGGYHPQTGPNPLIGPAIVIDDLATGQRQFLTSDRADYQQVLDLGNGLAAFVYSSSSTPNLMSFTLLNVHDLSQIFVSFDAQPDNMNDTEIIESIRRLDSDRILVLTSKAIWIYNLPAQQFESQHLLPTHIEHAFDIWPAA